MNTELSTDMSIQTDTTDTSKVNVDTLEKFLIQAHKLRIAITKANIQVDTLEKDILQSTFLDFCSAFDEYLKSIHVKIA